MFVILYGVIQNNNNSYYQSTPRTQIGMTNLSAFPASGCGVLCPPILLPYPEFSNGGGFPSAKSAARRQDGLVPLNTSKKFFPNIIF